MGIVTAMAGGFEFINDGMILRSGVTILLWCFIEWFYDDNDLDARNAMTVQGWLGYNNLTVRLLIHVILKRLIEEL